MESGIVTYPPNSKYNPVKSSFNPKYGIPNEQSVQ